MQPSDVVIAKNLNKKKLLNKELSSMKEKIEERFQESTINKEYAFKRSYNGGFISNRGLKPIIKGVKAAPTQSDVQDK